MRWELPVEQGKIVVSLKPPNFGIPPWAFISPTSDPTFYPELQNCKLKAADATEITKFHRWLMQDVPTLDDSFADLNIFHISLKLNDDYKTCSLTPGNGSMHAFHFYLCFASKTELLCLFLSTDACSLNSGLKMANWRKKGDSFLLYPDYKKEEHIKLVLSTIKNLLQATFKEDNVRKVLTEWETKISNIDYTKTDYNYETSLGVPWLGSTLLGDHVNQIFEGSPNRLILFNKFDDKSATFELDFHQFGKSSKIGSFITIYLNLSIL